jgi:hypothetical protein
MVWFTGTIVWVLLCILVGKCADRWNRSFGKYLILSFILSPLIMGIILLIMGKNEVHYYKSSYNTKGISSNSSKSDEEIRPLFLNSDNNKMPVSTTNYQKTNVDTKKCPFCAELIKKEAILCRYCGKSMEEFEEKMKLSNKGNQTNEIISDENIYLKNFEIGKNYVTIKKTVVKPAPDIYRRSIDLYEDNTNVKLLKIGERINENQEYFWINVLNENNQREGWISSECLFTIGKKET